MAKTLNQQQLEEIVKQCAERTLANAGFKRRGTDFARLIEPGFIHLIEFGLGNPWSSYEGKFALDLAVYIEEAFTVLHDAKAPRRPTSTHCDLRDRVAMLGPPPVSDKWWSLNDPITRLQPEIQAQLSDVALPFLEPLRGRHAFIQRWEEVGSAALHLNPRGDIVAGIVLKHLGYDARAKEVIGGAVSASVGTPTNAFYRMIANRYGYLNDGGGSNA